jgi:trk system potassium uptake protein TrkA
MTSKVAGVEDTMYAVIIGCGRVGTLLAQLLEADGHHVAVVDKNPQAFRRLMPGFRGRTVAGVGFDRDTLHDAGIERADAFAAVTSGDNSNFIAAMVARDTFQIPTVVARISDPQREQIYRRLGIRTLSSTEWGAHTLKHMLLGTDEQPPHALGNGTVQLLRGVVGTQLAGRSVGDVASDGAVCVFGVVRNGEALIPLPSTPLQAGDELHLSVHTHALERVTSLLQA